MQKRVPIGPYILTRPLHRKHLFKAGSFHAFSPSRDTQERWISWESRKDIYEY